MKTTQPFDRERGISLVELMVGVVIGLIAVLVIYQMFAISEGYKRNTTAVGDAQQNGLFSSFTLGIELANAGNGLEVSGQALATCQNTNDIATTLRPIPVLITDSGDPNTPDSFVVNYSVAARLVSPATFTATDPDTTRYHVRSPNGFQVGDWIAAVDSGGLCALSKVTAITPDGAPWPDFNVDGTVQITHTGAPRTYSTDSKLVNLGPSNRAQRVRFDIATDVLRSQNLLNGEVANPLTSNVVNMKVQYGVDTGGAELTWTSAAAAGWTPDAVLGATLSALSKIKAVRIGIIVRSEQFDKEQGAFDWTLFNDCGAVFPATCAGIVAGSIAPSTNPPGNWRYRIYQTVIPLRNTIWNPA